MATAPVKDPVSARQATKENVGRWILGISTGAVVVVLFVVWALAR